MPIQIIDEDSLVDLLARFACYLSPVWDVDNSDDIASARKRAREYLEEEGYFEA